MKKVLLSIIAGAAVVALLAVLGVLLGAALIVAAVSALLDGVCWMLDTAILFLLDATAWLREWAGFPADPRIAELKKSILALGE